MKKRITVALLAALTLSSVSCGGETPDVTDETTSADTTTEPETTRFGTLDPNLNFGGEVIRILCRDNESNAAYHNEFGVTTITGDVVDDAIYQRNLDVEALLNIKIQTTTMNGAWDNKDAFMTMIRNGVMSDDDGYDLVTGYQAYITTLAVEGYFSDLSGMKHVDLTNPWWNQTFLEQNLIGNKCFFLAGDIGLSYTTSTNVIYFNKRLAEDLGIKDLYDTVRDGKWTREKIYEYSELAADDLNGDTVMDDENDRWGYACTGAFEPFIALGGEFTKLVNGRPTIDLPNEHTSDVIAWTVGFLNDSKSAKLFSGGYENAMNVFRSGRALFYCSYIGRADELREVDFDYGNIPYYKWDEAQENYISMTHNGMSLFCVPKGARNEEALGAAMEALAMEGYRSVVPAYYDIALQGKYTRDEDSNEMLDLIKSTITIPFWYVWSNDIGGIAGTSSTLVRANNPNFESYSASLTGSWQKSIDSLTELLSSVED